MSDEINETKNVNKEQNYATKTMDNYINNDRYLSTHFREVKNTLRAMAWDAYQVKEKIWTEDQFVQFKTANAIRDHFEDCLFSDSLNMIRNAMIRVAFSEVDWDDIAKDISEEEC